MSEDRDIVIAALEKTSYDWRTVDGIVKETALSHDKVLEALKQLEKLVVRSSVPDNEGRALYTTRKHYYKNQNVFTRYLTAASGSIKK